MADGLGVKQFQVHQALHGYRDGHRLLASSMALKPRDQKTMLALSDVSGPGARIGELGYLTGYPLPDSGYYAIARTWNAAEMPRPGCVWTHTLLIDFADLATLAASEPLNSVFRRPNSPDESCYGEPITVGTGAAGASEIGDDGKTWLKGLLAAVYGHPRDKVIASQRGDIDHEKLVLMIWTQQWPRLRRSFRFCTQAGTDRSGDAGVFDLQILPAQDRAARSRFPDAVEVEAADKTSADWMQSAFDDLQYPGDLRDFLRRIGGDMPNGREAFTPLCQLHRVLAEISGRATALAEAIGLVEGPLAIAEDRLARELVTDEVLAGADALDDRTLDYLVRHLDHLDLSAGADRADPVGHAVWKRDPARVIAMLNATNASRTLAERTVDRLPIDALVDGLKQTRNVIPVVLKRRPDLVGDAGFWNLDEAAAEPAFEVAVASDEIRSAAAAAMIACGRSGLADRMASRLGLECILAALLARLDELGTEDPNGELSRWICHGVSSDTVVAQALSSGGPRARTSLVALAQATSPDFVPNVWGEDPWLIALRTAHGSATSDGTTYLAAYALARAFGYRSRNQADLARYAFDDVYAATASTRLSETAWRLLEQRLPRSIFWFEWDRCQRLRNGIAALFSERDLAPAAFGEVTANDELFIEIAKCVSRTFRGDQYLRRVARTLEELDRGRFLERIGALKLLVE